MKRFHRFTLVCFAIAMLLYAVAWMPGAIGFGVFGVVFEIVGWVSLFPDHRKARRVGLGHHERSEGPRSSVPSPIKSRSVPGLRRIRDG